MKYVLSAILILVLFSANAQFPGTDSLRNYNNKYITNNAATAFTSLRLNTLIRGIIDWVDTARAGTGGGGAIGVDTLYALNDSTVRYRKNGVFRNVIVKGVYDNRRKVDSIYLSNDSTLAFTMNGTQRTIIIPSSVDNSITTGNRTVLSDYVQNWNEHSLSINNTKIFEVNSNSVDPNYPGNRKVFRFYSDSTVNGPPLQLTWGLKNVVNDLTDSVHFELTSTLDSTKLLQHGLDGARSIELDLNGNKTNPDVRILANGNSKSSIYQFGPTGILQPNDSLRVKAVPATIADSVLAVRAFANGANTVIKLPATAIGPPLSNVGSGFRWVKTAGGQVKTAENTNTITWDSTANTLKANADTSYIATQSDLRAATEKVTRTVSSNTSSAANDGEILCNTTSGDITVTISTTTANRVTIQKITSDFNKVIISCASGTIRGNSTLELTGTWESVTIFTNGTNFFVK